MDTTRSDKPLDITMYYMYVLCEREKGYFYDWKPTSFFLSEDKLRDAALGRMFYLREAAKTNEELYKMQLGYYEMPWPGSETPDIVPFNKEMKQIWRV